MLPQIRPCHVLLISFQIPYWPIFISGVLTRGPHVALKFVLCGPRPHFKIIRIYITKITQQFRRLRVPHIVILTSAAREPAHNNGCGPLKGGGGRKMLDTSDLYRWRYTCSMSHWQRCKIHKINKRSHSNICTHTVTDWIPTVLWINNWH
jgi:hypothetical protein